MNLRTLSVVSTHSGRSCNKQPCVFQFQRIAFFNRLSTLPENELCKNNHTVGAITRCMPTSVCHPPQPCKTICLLLRLKPILRNPLQAELVSCDTPLNKPFWKHQKPYPAPLPLPHALSLALMHFQKGPRGPAGTLFITAGEAMCALPTVLLIYRNRACWASLLRSRHKLMDGSQWKVTLMFHPFQCPRRGGFKKNARAAAERADKRANEIRTSPFKGLTFSRDRSRISLSQRLQPCS